MVKRNDTVRVYVIFGCVLAASVLIGWKLFVLSYIDHTLYSKTAQAQNQNISNILLRGNIYIQDPKSQEGGSHLFLAATNQKVQKDQNGKTVFETDRYYPADSMLSDVLGFFGYSNTGRAGQYGIEAYFDDELSGRASTVSTSTSSGAIHGIWSTMKHYVGSLAIPAISSPAVPRPADVVLTVDHNIQLFIENELAMTMKKWSASGGTIIVQDPQTGKILGMADWPSFNLNSYSAAQPQTYLNSDVQEVFEPGSSFKPITMAAGLDLNKVTPDTTFTDPGVVTIAGHDIRNYDNQAHGVNTMTQVLEHSLNTGAMYVEGLVGDDNFLNYLINFGFGQKTGVDLPGEVNGDIANLYSGRKINDLTASFGQGIAVTPIQLVNAYSAIANGGKLMKPYIVDHIAYEGGKNEVTQPEVVSIPISEKTSQKLRTMLVSVVDHGFDKARITGYDIAGKTGTAQIPDGHGGYEEKVFIHDFLGFAPASNPKFVVLIKMDRPQGITFAADSLSPTFRDIAQYLINYLNIPPTR